MNAIILAAGLGSRFKDVTKNNHKALLPIGDVPNIERTIGYLRDFGVYDITIVTGHMSKLFDYLKYKYGCNLIFNEKYKIYNNIYSFYKAIDHFNDTIIIDADIVLLDNIFVKKKESFYYTVLREENEDYEWVPIEDNKGRVIGMDITNEYKPSMLGISYWNNEACKIIKSKVDTYMEEKILLNPKLYWDNIPINLFNKIYVTTHFVSDNLAAEMDTIENYNEICKMV